MEFMLTLPAEVLAPRMVRGALAVLAPVFPPAFVDDVRLLADELVTNAIKHGGLRPSDHVQVVARGSPERVRVEVIGGRRRLYVLPARPGLAQSSGWGLFLVGALSNRWGFRDGGATAVWFEMDRERRLSTEPLPPEVEDQHEGWNGVHSRRRRTGPPSAAS
jgi:anti-sigma regulatory factor (Ser/Thr protein kinase)